MVQHIGQNLPLGEESPLEFGVRESAAHELDGNARPVCLVRAFGQPHRAHAPASQFVQQPVGAHGLRRGDRRGREFLRGLVHRSADEGAAVDGVIGA